MRVLSLIVAMLAFVACKSDNSPVLHLSGIDATENNWRSYVAGVAGQSASEHDAICVKIRGTDSQIGAALALAFTTAAQQTGYPPQLQQVAGQRATPTDQARAGTIAREECAKG